MATRSSRNNLLAGILFVVSLALAVAVVISLSDLGERLTPMNAYKVRFPLAIGAEGLKQGSLVKVGGQPVGRVVGWEFDRSGPDDDPTGILVGVKIRADVRIYSDAVVNLHLALLGSNSYINIPNLGGPRSSAGSSSSSESARDGKPTADGQPPPPRSEAPAAALANGATIEGRLAPPAFLEQAGYGPEQVTKVQAAIDGISRMVADAEVQWNTSVRETLAGVRAVVADAQAAWPGWRDRVTAVLDNIRAASEDARAGVESARAMIDENRPRVGQALQDVEALARKASTEGWDSVMAMLERGRKGVDDFADVAERSDRLLRESVPQLRTTVANARLASEELKLTLAEVRAAPWKLLAKPTGRKELENEVLYDAARAYAVAVSNLKATATALESVAAADGGPDDKEQVAALVSDLQDAFARYREAEKRFLDRLR